MSEEITNVNINALSIEALIALPLPILLIDNNNDISFANPAAEEFFHLSIQMLSQRNLQDIIPPDSPLMTLTHKVRRYGNSVQEFDISLSTPRTGDRLLTVNAAPLGSGLPLVVLVLNEMTVASRIDKSLIHRDVARSVSAMSAVLAHEIKNPLSGVRSRPTFRTNG